MKTVNVKFLKYHSWGSKGDVVNVSEDVAERLVAGKYAVVVPSEAKPEVAPKTRRKTSNKAMTAQD